MIVIAGLSAGVAVEFLVPAMIRRSVLLRSTVVVGLIAVITCSLSVKWSTMKPIGAISGLLSGILPLVSRVREFKSGHFGASGFSIRGAPPYTLLVFLGVYALLA